MRILIVDDDKSTRDLLKYYLCDHLAHRDCETASSLSQAIEMVISKHYDLILVDLWLDGEISIPIIKCARELYPTDPPYICLMSAATGMDRIVNKIKANRYIEKPFALETIDELVFPRFFQQI